MLSPSYYTYPSPHTSTLISHARERGRNNKEMIMDVSSPSNASFSSISSPPLSSPNNTPLVSIQCFKTNSKAEEWTADTLHTGDIVEIIAVGNLTVRAPFKNGRIGVQKILHECYKSRDTSIRVRVRRGLDEFAEFEGCIVPNESAGRKQYLLRSTRDPGYAVGFVNRTEAECFNLQASRNSRMVDALAKTLLQDGHVAYPWGRKMLEQLQVPNSSFFLSMLFLPRTSDRNPSRYNDLEDTLARSNAWLTSSQASGVPQQFTVFACFVPQGFIYISSVAEDDDDAPSTRSGLCSLYKEANRSGKLLVISRVSNQKVLPWIVSQTGAIRCYDTVSLSQKLSLHRHARVSIYIHIFSWDQGVGSLIKGLSLMPPTECADDKQATPFRYDESNESSQSSIRSKDGLELRP